MIFLNVISGGLSFALAMLSAQGSILDVQKRRHVTTLIYARLPIFFLEMTWTVATTMIAFDLFNTGSVCKIETGIRIAVILEWILVLSLFVAAIFIFNPLESRRMDRSMVDERLYWKRKFFLCKMRQDQQVRQALDDIAALLSAFFSENDYVLSDIIAGLLLLVHSPHKRIPPAINPVEKSAQFPEWMKLPNCLEPAHRYLKLSVAVYGWPQYIVGNCGCSSWCLLCRRLSCCKTQSGETDLLIVEDNCCSCHSSALMLTLDSDCKLCFLSYRNGLFEAPFAVIIDQRTNAIVIAIRGSASFMDIVTDLSLNEDLFSSIDVDSDPILRSDKELDGHGEVRVHRGILKGARYIYETLATNHVLEDLEIQYPNYHIAICGHSLGAGIGSLLALLLKLKYSDVRCFAFAPPGSVISENGIADTEKSTLTILVGDDMIPRMTYQSIHLLKIEIEREIASTDKAKYEILIKGIFKLFISYPFSLHRDDSLSTQGFCHVPENESRPSMEGNREERVQLRPPGHLLHLTCPDKDEVKMQWIHNRTLSEIQLTSSMLRDHLPFNIQKILKRACEQTKCSQ